MTKMIITASSMCSGKAAAGHYREALERNRELDRQAAMANVLQGLGLTEQARGRYAEAMKWLIESKDLYIQLKLDNQIADLEGRIGKLFRLWGKFDKSEHHYREALSRYEALGQQDAVAAELFSWGLTEKARGDGGSALELFSRSYEMYVQMRCLEDAAKLQTYIGEVHLEAGDHDLARTSFSIAHELSLAHEYRVEESRSLLGLGRCLELERDFENAITNFEKVIFLCQNFDEPELMAKAQLGLARCLWRVDDKDCSQSVIAETLKKLETRNRKYDLADFHQGLGAFYLSVSDSAFAGQHLNRALDLFKELEAEHQISKIEELLQRLETP